MLIVMLIFVYPTQACVIKYSPSICNTVDLFKVVWTKTDEMTVLSVSFSGEFIIMWPTMWKKIIHICTFNILNPSKYNVLPPGVRHESKSFVKIGSK